jgi:PHD/YefM family antitoxin component YafN of YafNO toxin-antitoxin module
MVGMELLIVFENAHPPIMVKSHKKPRAVILEGERESYLIHK